MVLCMKISVRVKPNSKIEKVDKLNDKEYILSVKAQAKEGKANEAAIKLLSQYFGLPKSRIIILKGNTCKNKIIELLC